MKKQAVITFITSIFSSLLCFGAMPAGYYNDCENKGGETLIKALHSTITDHTALSYGDLWTLYKTSDVYDDGTIWDMYSTKHWVYSKEQCGTYSSLGDCYNREHSFPKSWFNDATPMYTDAFHLYPTDGKVNGQRSNYPFGECKNGTSIASKGTIKALGKLGASTFEGYTKTVFEPDDEYKGDFARSYFYMAACYYDRIKNWNSDMLAGNSFPAFSSWALKLLLKWHRQDPVSDKERKRQEAVYAVQHNRNPFIDYPEMVEYIWGDKSTEKWTTSGTAKTSIVLPAVSTIDVGISRKGVATTKDITVRTENASTPVTLAIDNAVFKLSTTSISASTANTGTTVTITFTPSATGTATATLTISAGAVVKKVTLTGKCVDGLPVQEPSVIYSNGFVLNWTYVGDEIDGTYYRLTVSDNEGIMPGYPKNVEAQAERFVVSGLESATQYSVLLESKTLKSNTLKVTTGAPLPSIDFLYDGELDFHAIAGTPSDDAEILISTDNIDDYYTVSVSKPFELSTDHSSWVQKLTLSADEDRFYLRLNSDTPGSYTTALEGEYGDYCNNDIVISGTVSSGESFLEDFEAESHLNSYTGGAYNGTACLWQFNDAGFFGGDAAYSGEQVVRAGRNGVSQLSMEEDFMQGVATVSFYAKRWQNDGAATLAVQYSTDGGKTYTEAGTVIIDCLDYQKFNVHVGSNTATRVRLTQTDGKRYFLDDFALTANVTDVESVIPAHHLWDAYSRGGNLIIDVKDDSLTFAVYAIDGTTLHSGTLNQGCNTITGLQPGMVYIVYCSDFSRTVLIR